MHEGPGGTRCSDCRPPVRQCSRAPPTTLLARALCRARRISRAHPRGDAAARRHAAGLWRRDQRMGLGGRDRRLLGAFFARALGGQRGNGHRFLASRTANPSSIRSCFEVARSNARAVRTALTIEMWDAINGAWLELKRFGNQPASREEFARFLRWVQESSLRFDGSAYRTMLRNDAYWFSRLGVFIERADNTARILDVKYHLLLPATSTSAARSTISSGGDPARGLGADRLSLGLPREPEALADRRPADPERADAALACELLREHGAESRPHRRAPTAGRARPSGRRAIRTRLAEQPHGGDLPAWPARIHRRSSPTTTVSAAPSPQQYLLDAARDAPGAVIVIIAADDRPHAHPRFARDHLSLRTPATA